MTKIYAGNLPFSSDENEIRELFAQHGTVESVILIADRETGRPRGFGAPVRNFRFWGKRKPYLLWNVNCAARAACRQSSYTSLRHRSAR